MTDNVFEKIAVRYDSEEKNLANIIVEAIREELVNSQSKVHNGLVHADLKEKLSEVGFKTTIITTFYHGENIFMKQDASMFISSSIKE